MRPKKISGRGEKDSSSGGAVAQVRLSKDSEQRLQKLVADVGQNVVNEDTIIFEGQKKQIEKKLRKIYDSLANEGFNVQQIQSAISAIPAGRITLETALDWLCINLSQNDLPLKFTSGISVDHKEGSVQVLAISDSTKVQPSKPDLEKEFENFMKIDHRLKREETRDDKSQTDWIRQYMAQQEEDSDDESVNSDWEERTEVVRVQVPTPSYQRRLPARDLSTRKKEIVHDYVAAKQAAIDAKQKNDKPAQSEASRVLRLLKEEMLSLGFSQDYIAEIGRLPKPAEKKLDKKRVSENEVRDKSAETAENIKEEVPEVDEVVLPTPVKTELSTASAEDDGAMMGMFDEESAEQSLPKSVLRLAMKEKVLAWGMEDTSRATTSKKGKITIHEESQRHPRAVLQQHCLKNKYGAPKYEKLSSKSGTYRYAITLLRPVSGRGKQKKGGLVTLSLPEDEDDFHSVSDAQDAVATWSLMSLFSELPLYRVLPEPFKSMWLRWHEQANEVIKDEDVESRDLFIKTLLESRISAQSKASKPESIASTPKLECDADALPPSAIPETETNAVSFVNPAHEAASIRLKHMQENKLQNRDYKAMLQSRGSLPIASVREELLRNLEHNDVVVVSGETGSGKTTQVPQFILDDKIMAGKGGFCKIICTQPRRIAAVSVAERVAAERCEPPPGSSGSLVGYQVRLDASWSLETRLLFCTTGILLRRISGDRQLADVTHVIVDEVHERTVLGDFLMSLLKDLLEKRNVKGSSSPLKVILMSATLDAERFSRYFGDCPVIIAEGRTFPVTTFYLEDIYEEISYKLSSDSPAAVHNSSKYNKRSSRNIIDSGRGRQDLALSGWGDEKLLEEAAVNPNYEASLYRNFNEVTRANLAKVNEDIIDYELLEDLIIYINETGEAGALLVFLPGMPEIQQLLDRLSAIRSFSGSASEWLLPLHSSVAPAEQKKVFQIPPKQFRKIVLATNIAETSVTIQDVVHVIDCGKHKENRFDPRRRMSRMEEAWISQANARQRRGRAGRVQPGNCYCLYTHKRYEKLMRPFQLPEMLRVPLVELCLQIKLLSTLDNAASFLEKVLDPPKIDAVESALSILREVGALDEKENLTPLGHRLAALPVDVHIGKMMVYGALLGCLSPVLTIAAYLSHKSPFVTPTGQRDAAERAKHGFAAAESDCIASKQHSDHLVIVAAYTNWRRAMSQGGSRAARQFCDSHFLSVPILHMLREMRIQFANLLVDIGFIPKGAKNVRGEGDWLDDMNLTFNRNSACAPVIKAVLCAGLYPNVAAMMEESVKGGHANALNMRAGLCTEKKPLWSDGRRQVYIHPSSINANLLQFPYPYLLFHDKVETSRVFLRDTTVISPFALLLFGGVIKVQHQIGNVSVDGWMKMNVATQSAVLFKEVRGSLDSILDDMTQGLCSSKAMEVVSSILQLLIQVETPHTSLTC